MPTGRPRASSREILAEAACELFLEQGFDDTSISEIATRAGVSRSSFFNYFASKSDILWSPLDERITSLTAHLAPGGPLWPTRPAAADDLGPDPGEASEPRGGADRTATGETTAVSRAVADVRAALLVLADSLAPDSLALAITNADQMAVSEELEREASLRRSRIADAVTARLRFAGVEALRAEIVGAAHGGAVLAAVRAWAHAGPGRARLGDFLAEALDVAAATLPVPVRG